ncbi:MAG: inositol monophosphatase [Candidatus Dormibacteraeota bacterium]|nr:inositol monophosphatase [Candidatus Dormibacteraeota bacterium]
MLREGGLARRPGETKAAGDYVTQTDLSSEAAILEVLAREAPGVAVLAEEAGGARADTMWAVDPLDGTTNFMRGFPVVGVSVALVRSGTPELGVVIAPWLGLEFAVQRGRGATLNGERLPTLSPVDPARAVVSTGFPFRRKHRLPEYNSVFTGAFERFEDLRRPGAACLDLAWTSTGTFDGFFELGMGTWDIAGGAALVLEVGGRVTDWSGGSAWIESGDVLAAAPAVHEVLLELAREAPEG